MVYPPWGGGVPAGLRELSGFWGRIKGIKEIRAGFRELVDFGAGLRELRTGFRELTVCAATRFGASKTVFPKCFGEFYIQNFRLRRCSESA